MNKLWTCQILPSKTPFSEYSGKYLQKRVRKPFIHAGSRRQVWKWRSPLSGHWHKDILHITDGTGHLSGNEGRPFQGIDTLKSKSLASKFVTWKWRSPLSGHWHNINAISVTQIPAIGGNEGRPFQGIDTSSSAFFNASESTVEMKVAPFRALTP